MNSEVKRQKIQNIKSQIIKIEGVKAVAELNKEQFSNVLNLENKAMENVLCGMGKGRNEGVKDSVSREIVLVLFTDINFQIPKDTNLMELISEGKVVGFVTEDKIRVNEFKKDKRYLVISDYLIIEKGAKINRSAFDSGNTYFLFSGFQIEEFFKIPDVERHVFSLPSPPGFDYLKNEFKDKMNLDDPQLAGILLGLDLKKDTRPYLISCGILRKEIDSLINNGSLDVNPIFLDAGLHTDYDELEIKLEQVIRESEKNPSNGVIIVYGDVCHPKMQDIIKKHNKVVKVDALNCIDCLLGGHGKLLEIDPNHDYFYLSPGWMLSNLKEDDRFKRIFDYTDDEFKNSFSKLSGIIIFRISGDSNDYTKDVKLFCDITGLPVLYEREIRLEKLKDVILEAINKLDKNQ